MGLPPSIGPRSGRDQPGVSIRKRVPIVGRCFRSSSFSESCGAESPSPFAKRARDQASAVDVGSDSNCGGASRERARLRLLLIVPEIWIAGLFFEQSELFPSGSGVKGSSARARCAF